MAGIKEVAKIAGVSISTVSYALNGSDKISEPTRLRIQEIAKSVGYVPKMAARTLKGNKTNIIGIYISDFQGEFYGDLLNGIQQQLKKRGYDMMVNSGNRTRKFLLEKLFDGAIILDSKFLDTDLKRVLENDSKVVVLDREVNHDNARTVLLDNNSGTVEAINYLLSQKLDCYYIISGPLGSYDGNIRLQTAQEVFAQDGVDFEVIAGDFTEQSGFFAAEQIIPLTVGKTVGIYALNDNEAMGFYRYAIMNKINIEKDFKLVGFDNNHSADFLNPLLPSVSYRKHLWGKTAADTLIDLIENKEEVENKIIKTQLSFREYSPFKDSP